MLCADGTAVCATSEGDLNIIIQTFYEVFADFGLQMTLKKTSNPNSTDPVIHISNKMLQVVDKFKYGNLGSVLKTMPLQTKK